MSSELLTSECLSDVGMYTSSTGDLFPDIFNDRSVCWTAWLGPDNIIKTIDGSLPADRRNIPADLKRHSMIYTRVAQSVDRGQHAAPDTCYVVSGDICEEKTFPTPFPGKVEIERRRNF